MALAIGSSNTYSNNSGTVASHPVNLPTGISAGNLLLMFFIANGSPTVTDPSGWSLLASGATPGTYDTIRLYGKIASGSEGATETVALSANNRASAITYLVTGNRNGVTSSEIAVSAVNEQGSGINHDPPNLTPSWGSEENLWFAIAFCQDGAMTWSAYPTNYSLGQNAVNTGSGNGNAVAAAARLLTATSEDPGAFTTVTNRQRSSFTLAVRPNVTAITADASITEAADTVSGVGSLTIVGTLSKTEASDTLSSTGALAVQGVASITEAHDTLLADGTSATTGTLTVTEANDTVSSTGALAIAGALSKTEASDTLSSAATLAIVGTLSKTEANDTLSSAAVLVKTGSAAITEQPDTLSSSARLEIHAIAAMIEAGDILVSTATVPIIPSMDFSVGAIPGLSTSVVQGANLSGSVQPSLNMSGSVQRSAGMSSSVQRNVTQRQSVRQ